MKRLALISFLFIFSVKTFGADYDLAKSNVAAELAQCTAYFYQVAECVNNTQPGSDLARQLQQTAGNTHLMAIGASNQEVANARFMLYADEMLKEIKSHCSNVAIIMQKYGETCKAAIEDPEARLKYWVEIQ